MKTILNHEMVKIIQKDNTYVLSMRMRDGQWAIQHPYEGNQRGLIGAMTLAIDVLAGKVMLAGIEASAPSQSKPVNTPELIDISVVKQLKG